METRCEACGHAVRVGYMRQHYRNSPRCDRDTDGPSPPKRDREVHFNFFKKRLYALLSTELWDAHTDHKIEVAHLQVFLTVVIGIVKLAITFILTELRTETDQDKGNSLSTVECLADVVMQSLLAVPSARSIIDAKRSSFLLVEPIVIQREDNVKIGCKFSLIQLLSVMLTESSTIRKHTKKSSDLWKTGDLHCTMPEQYSDVIHGSRFRNSDICKKATPDQTNDWRIVLHLWNDAMTSVDGMGKKAAENKWEVVLASLVNLPLWMRHYFDHLLLLALVQSKWAVKNGGVARILCGVDDEGKEMNAEYDKINLYQEISASKRGEVDIQLPDDENPANEDGIKVRLVVYILVISLDWLANGGFGPFAEGVQAVRPCFKCAWTDRCLCAWIARTDARNDTITHHPQCRRRRTRSHAEVMQVVAEMRELNATDLKARQTEEGIFSTTFASAYLLSDIVRDASVDIMHIFFSSGIVPYMASWLLDIYIPTEFSFPDLWQAVKDYNGKKRGHYIPKIYRSGNTNRGSAKLPLTAAEAMAFALASPYIMEHTLVKDVTTPHWQAWLKLVKLLRFVLRRRFSLDDPCAVQVLYDDFMHAVELVPQWKGRQKPKFHLPDHLADALKEQGPWRAYWCMWGEGFLQYLKALFEMTNYKGAAVTVATLWAAKAVQRYRNPHRTAWHEDSVEPTLPDDFLPCAKLLPPMSTFMATSTSREWPLNARHLSAFTRERVTIYLQDWLLVSVSGLGLPGCTVVGQCTEMIQMHIVLKSPDRVVCAVRMMLSHVMQPTFDEQDICTVSTAEGHHVLYLPLETAHVTLMTHEHGSAGLVRLRV